MHEMSCNRWFLESTCHYNLIRVVYESCALVLKIYTTKLAKQIFSFCLDLQF